MEETRFELFVCDGCGVYGTERDLDRWGQCLVRHEGKPTQDCIKPARLVTAVPEPLLLTALEVLEEIAGWPTQELNPDGKDQAAHSMQLIASQTAELVRSQLRGEHRE